MSPVVEPHVEDYAVAASSPHPLDELFDRLAAETHERTSTPQMMVGPLEGRFLELLVRLTRARRVLELGTFTGWSSIVMALALPPDASLVSCDVNESTTAIARKYAAEAGVAERIDYRIGHGLDLLAELAGPFDLVFIDADKGSYVDYYDAVLPKLAPDGVIAADNTLFGTEDGEIGRSIQRFNEHVLRDERVECVLVPIRDGVTLIRKREVARGS
jgi:caffeoyl-CoA O-methyltransferase